MGDAAIFGASGAIGAALVRQLARRGDGGVIHAGSRAGLAGRDWPVTAPIRPFRFDYADPASLAAAVTGICAGPLPDPVLPELVLIATGRLTRADGTGPEKSWRAVTAESLGEMLAINAIGPALVVRECLARLPRDRRVVLAALSARVGSIADNRLGGWHGYRAAKAALNMLMRNAAIELARTHPHAIVVTLHPGTVDTPLSAPFQRGVAPGKLFAPDHAAACLLDVIEGLTPADSGGFFAWDGAPIPY